MRDIAEVQRQIKQINFSDAHIQHVEVKNGEVLITVQNWQEKTLRLRFDGVVYFKAFEFGGDLYEVQVSDNTAEIKEAMRAIINSGGSAAAYPGLIQVSFMADAPVMVVVFQEFANES